MIEQNALRDINDPKAGDLLLAALEQKNTRWSAACSLARLQDIRAVGPLIELLYSSEGEDRRIAADNLGSFKDQRATDPLVRALKDHDEVVRRYAASSLGELGDLHSVGPLSAALTDPDAGVRWNASNSLGYLKDFRAVQPLASVLTDDDDNVRKAAAEALAKLPDPRAVAPLIAAIRSGHRWYPAAALANIKDSRAADFLNESLKQGQLDIVAAAHSFFIDQGDPATVRALIEALNKHGNSEMAQNYMYCGNPKLEVAAREWASRHDYDGLLPPEGSALIWGVINDSLKRSLQQEFVPTGSLRRVSLSGLFPPNPLRGS